MLMKVYINQSNVTAYKTFSLDVFKEKLTKKIKDIVLYAVRKKLFDDSY